MAMPVPYNPADEFIGETSPEEIVQVLDSTLGDNRDWQVIREYFLSGESYHRSREYYYAMGRLRERLQKAKLNPFNLPVPTPKQRKSPKFKRRFQFQCIATGEIVETSNISDFCRSRGLLASPMSRVWHGGLPHHRGWIKKSFDP